MQLSTQQLIYCESCLEYVLKNNQNLCPINNHRGPEYSSCLIYKKDILRLKISCINSTDE